MTLRDKEYPNYWERVVIDLLRDGETIRYQSNPDKVRLAIVNWCNYVAMVNAGEDVKEQQAFSGITAVAEGCKVIFRKRIGG